MSLNTLQSIVFYMQGAMPLLLLVVVVAFGILVFRFRSPNRKQHALRLVVAIAVFTATGFALHRLVHAEYIARRETGRADRYAAVALVNVGDPIPSFELTDIDNATFSTDDLQGKVLLINFFATWCGPCKQELPHLAAIHDELQSNPDFRAIVISRGETAEIVREFRNKRQLTLPMAADTDETVFAKFVSDGACIPRTIVVAKDGTIAYSKGEFYERDISQIQRLIQASL